ncbi:MAG: hypothetical protein IKX30_09445 [Victivallales bacterium]|nr:hypothetical protein [Victivallales bacterium]
MATSAKNQKNQLIVLLVLVAVFICFLAYQFRGAVKLPTKARVVQLQKKLKDAQENLAIAQQEKEAFEQEIGELRTLSEPFWDPSNQRAIEQEVQLRFEGIARDAKLTWKNVKAQRTKSNLRNNIQEVEVRMDIDSLTMQDLGIFFEKIEEFMNRTHRRFYMSNFRLSTAPVRVARMPGQPGGPGMPGAPSFITWGVSTTGLCPHLTKVHPSTTHKTMPTKPLPPTCAASRKTSAMATTS